MGKWHVNSKKNWESEKSQCFGLPAFRCPGRSVWKHCELRGAFAGRLILFSISLPCRVIQLIVFHRHFVIGASLLPCPARGLWGKHLARLNAKAAERKVGTRPWAAALSLLWTADFRFHQGSIARPLKPEWPGAVLSPPGPWVSLISEQSE